MDTARGLQILGDGFDSRLEPIAFDIFTEAVDSQSSSSLSNFLNLMNFQFNIIWRNLQLFVVILFIERIAEIYTPKNKLPDALSIA